MKEGNFIYRNSKWIIIAVTIASLVCACIQVGLNATKSIESQKQNLYSKEQILVQDTSNINKLERTRIYVSSETIAVTFIEDDCELQLVYDANWNLLEKELVETRLGATFFGTASYIVVIGIVGFGVSALVCVILAIILDECRIRKEIRQSKNNTENNGNGNASKQALLAVRKYGSKRNINSEDNGNANTLKQAPLAARKYGSKYKKNLDE